MRPSPHLNPVHVNQTPSLLSRIPILNTGEARNKKRQQEGRHSITPLDFSGFKHLVMILLVMGNLKVLKVDWNQFGLKKTLDHFGLGLHDLKMAGVVCVCVLLVIPVALVVERNTSTTSNTTIEAINPTKNVNTTIESSSTTSSITVNTSNTSEARIRASVNNTTTTTTTSINTNTLPRCAKYGYALQLILSFTCLLGGSFLTHTLIHHPLVAAGCESVVIVTFLKLVSFALTNFELRQATNVPEFYAHGPQYPHNLTLGNFMYFWVVPTLVYQPVYPQRPTVRWSRVLPLVGELLTMLILIWVLMMQMGLPILQHLVLSMDSWTMVVEDYITLASISITIWLAGFYALFQSLLNLLAELSKFADRNFYGDWWNAGSVGTFWRDWNRPVSNYFRRHLYVPLRLRGWSRTMASNAVFFVSALLHELLLGVATHNFNGVAFLCMMVQPIFILLTEPLERKRGRGTTIGNCVFWVSILFGQPTATVIYFLEWVSRHPTSQTPTSWWTDKFH